MMNINFSAVIITFNRNEKLILALKSVLNQKYKPKEIIIINNYKKKNKKKRFKM